MSKTRSPHTKLTVIDANSVDVPIPGTTIVFRVVRGETFPPDIELLLTAHGAKQKVADGIATSKLPRDEHARSTWARLQAGEWEGTRGSPTASAARVIEKFDDYLRAQAVLDIESAWAARGGAYATARNPKSSLHAAYQAAIADWCADADNIAFVRKLWERRLARLSQA